MNDQISVIQNVPNFLYLIEKKIDFFRYRSILLFEAKYKTKYGSGLKALTPKQMLQGLPIALTKVEAGTTSETLLNEIRKMIYFLYRAKEITKRVYNNIMNSINL